MKAHSTKLAVEAMKSHEVPSTVAYGDFNNDGLVDMAAVTSPTTITVSLANPDGSYTVSDTLTAPKNQQIHDITYVVDTDGDGDLDILARGTKGSGTGCWVNFLNNGDGTFEYTEPVKSSSPKWSKWWV